MSSPWSSVSVVLLTALFFGSVIHGNEYCSRHSATYEGDSEVAEGLPFQITCKISTHDFPQWTINGIEIPPDNDMGYTLDRQQTGRTFSTEILRATSAQILHEGEYRCNAYSRDFHFLEVISEDEEEQKADDDEDDEDEDKSFDNDKENSPSEFIVGLHETITLDCFSDEDDDDNEDDVKITWFKNGRMIMERDHDNVRLSDQMLIIEEAEEDDAGLYMCLMDASDRSGFNRIGRIFKAKLPARITDFQKKINAVIGGDMTLSCSTTGFPLPAITWFIGNERAEDLSKEDPRIQIYTEHPKKSVLTIRNLLQSDNGLYTCRANNSMGGKTSSQEEMCVFIHMRENMIETNEDIPGMGKLLIPGEQLVLSCNTTECPNCKVLWCKDGKKLVEDGNRIQIFENNSVVINDASYNDSGSYVCAIDRNQLDVALNASISVHSEIKLEKFESSSSVVVEGSPLKLHCKAKGAPPPQIKWFKGNEEITESHSRIKLDEYNGIKNATLFIEEADFEDRDHYTCEAYNQFNSVNATIFIRIKDKLAALWPFLGICAEVAILCSIIFVYERRKSKTQFEEPDTDHPIENKHVKDQKAKDKDVRQRK